MELQHSGKLFVNAIFANMGNYNTRSCREKEQQHENFSFILDLIMELRHKTTTTSWNYNTVSQKEGTTTLKGGSFNLK
jgi:hypothetical protein